MIVANPYARHDTVGMNGIFDSLVDVVWDKPRALVGDVLEKVQKLVVQVWAHLPSEVRQLAIKLGPLVANMYAPGSGEAAKLALQVLEGGRQAKVARKKLKEAQEEGQLPDASVLDLDDPEHVLALSRITEPEVQAASRRASGRSSAPLLALGVAAVFVAAGVWLSKRGAPS